MMVKKLFLALPIKPCIFKNANKVNEDRQRSKCPLCAISKKSDYVGHQNKRVSWQIQIVKDIFDVSKWFSEDLRQKK